MMGFNSYRKMLQMKKDPFDDYRLKETEEDKLKLIEFSNTLSEISKICFHQCADFSHEKFSRKEEKCVKNCVDFQYTNMLNIIKHHNKT